ELPYAVRKTYYARAGRIVKAPGVDAAVVSKYDLMKGDQERFDFMKQVLLDPTLGSVKVEEHYRSQQRNSKKDKYRY
ncbi:unnamed protein product, partial [Symbiodinium sp. CCMP2456]